MTSISVKSLLCGCAALACSAAISACDADARVKTDIEQHFASQAPEAELAAEAATAEDWLQAFYAERRLKPLWVGKRKADRRLKAYLSVLEQAADYGLVREEYAFTPLRAMASSRSNDDDAALELLASRSFAAFAMDLRDGRIPPVMDFTEEELRGEREREKEILSDFSKHPDPQKFLKEIRRDNPLQASLSQSLKRYKNIAESGGWSPVTLSADKLELGSTGPDVAAVARRLEAEGFFRGPFATAPMARQKTAGGEETDSAFTAAEDALYNERLERAVKEFQITRGIEPDGIVGGDTLARMNETPDELVDRIRLNLERARWLPQDFTERYVFVNIARYTAGLYENESRVGEIRAVVGKYHQQTPVFAGAMNYMVVNPYWNLPESIVRDEVAPKMAEDRHYLEKNNMEVVRGWDDPEPVPAGAIDWDDLPDNLDFRVRQKPGASNSLGHVKFMFPNDYNVYLHDTPADALFDRTKRAFSHGCIRLADPMAMAEWVLKDTPEYDRRKVETMIAEGGEETTIVLEKEIPVYIAYFTVDADETGVTYFLDDVYDRDPKLTAALGRAARQFAAGAAPQSLN